MSIACKVNYYLTLICLYFLKISPQNFSNTTAMKKKSFYSR